MAEPILVSYSQISVAIPSNEAAKEDFEISGVEMSPEEEVAFLARMARGLSRLKQEEKDNDPDVMVTAQDSFASVLQSHLAQRAKQTGKSEPLAAGGAEAKFDKKDLGGWAGVLWAKLKATMGPLPRPTPVAEEFPDKARVALVADWGTGLYGAPIIANTIEKDSTDYDLLLHLGDVYYSGTRDEVQNRFLGLWPRRPGTLSRALNSNHEMYSGGEGYFDLTLPEFGQKSSYFAMQNSAWLIVGLDTAYIDHAMDTEQVQWLEQVIADAGKRKVLLFSHHQLYSHLASQGTKLQERLGPLLDAGRVFGWYWGHEHVCEIFDRQQSSGLYGRCLGHGGMPHNRKKLKNLPAIESASDATWRRLEPEGTVPGSRILDGPNKYIATKPKKYAPHGYMTLELDGKRLTEIVHEPDGTEIYRRTLQAD